ncbi:sensor histidine kinase [Spirosoma pollinicola]|uniref:histidine kinase n=1 Tax=Spirosoma pollinicola TaxID=2057025 RepID=A0A2K8Z1U1_9BACT|nr:ATP-binding protein [Spirosoma pollinicola]AUD03846.1 PAS domain-containing sensor histidine kinase [Spirosoma pollinicola]
MSETSIPPNRTNQSENERLRFSLQAAGIGTWDLDLITKVAWWDQRTKELYGFTGTDTRDFQSEQDLMQYIHTQDRERMKDAMQRAMDPRSGGLYVIEFRIIKRDNGQVRWVRANGQAYFDGQGKAIRLSGTAQDITQQVLSRQLTEEVQEELRGAIELAQLGTWQVDLTTGYIDYSSRLKLWHGIEPHEVITAEHAFRRVPEGDHQQIKKSMLKAISLGSDGYYDIEYRLIDPIEGERIMHSQGKAYENQQGQIYKICGNVQDVTQQRKAQWALEQQVAQRTQQLEVSLEDLRRSNENLKQFAYVASHDLQEPLRKVQQFGDLLKRQYAPHLGEGVTYLDRMQLAAHRMSQLIHDLLSYSRIATGSERLESVSLEQVVQEVISDLDVVIDETGAYLDVSPLPTVSGDSSQLRQLFQNLISNALKFRQPNSNPVIHIRAHLIAADTLPDTVRPASGVSKYYKIDVSDNGIGFEEHHVERIFQVFQRLHGRNQYAGTGIGLAICEKVAANHGGTIRAQSSPGMGATFSVYLPD